MDMHSANNQRYVWKGKLADNKKRLEEIESKAENTLILLREKTDPTLELKDFDTQSIFILAKDFRSLQLEARKINEDIIELNTLLGNE